MNKRQFEVIRLAINICGSKARARPLLHRPFKIFDGKSMLQMIETDHGCDQVLEILFRIGEAYTPKATD